MEAPKATLDAMEVVVNSCSRNGNMETRTCMYVRLLVGVPPHVITSWSSRIANAYSKVGRNSDHISSTISSSPTSSKTHGSWTLQATQALVENDRARKDHALPYPLDYKLFSSKTAPTRVAVLYLRQVVVEALVQVRNHIKVYTENICCERRLGGVQVP